MGKSAPKLIRVSRSNVGLRESLAALRVVVRGNLGMGPETREFERELELFLGHRAVCTVNGTAALHLALQAIGIGANDEVLVPSLTYVATFQAIRATGAIPVACEVDPKSLHISLSDAEKRITSRTRALVIVNFAGEVIERELLANFTSKHNLRLVEDAAHSFGSRTNKGCLPEPIDLVAYSFDGIKNITSGEGGCVVSRDHTILDLVADLRLLGVQGDSTNRYSGGRTWNLEVKTQGWRYHMSDVMAAIGRIQLRRFAAQAKSRQAIAKRYDYFLANTPIETFRRNYDNTVPHIYPVLLPEGSPRDLIRSKLQESGIQTGIHYKPNHLLGFFWAATNLPITDNIYSRIISLPLHPKISKGDQVKVVATLLRELGLEKS